MPLHVRQSDHPSLHDITFFYSPQKNWINETIKNIEEYDIKLDIEESVAGFLGYTLNTMERWNNQA